MIKEEEYHKNLINRRVLLFLSTTKCDSGRLGTGTKTGSELGVKLGVNLPPQYELKIFLTTAFG